jgi:2,4-dienoyl-CoA reductase (NADPH2)
LSFATAAAQRGHQVTIFDSASEIGGQFNLAKKIPGKEEFYETLRYFGNMIKQHCVDLKLNTRVSAQQLIDMKFDHVVIATGVKPRVPQIPGIDHPKAVSYVDVLTGKVTVGKTVAVIGAGGIGFDVAEYLTEKDHSLSENPAEFAKYWGMDFTVQARGGVTGVDRKIPTPPRQVFLLQRKDGKLGDGLGKTTGWIHRTMLKDKNVRMLSSVIYEKIDDHGLHIRIREKSEILKVDHVVICAGQESLRELEKPLIQAGMNVTVIGGADLAQELDAKRAIDQGFRLAAKI